MKKNILLSAILFGLMILPQSAMGQGFLNKIAKKLAKTDEKTEITAKPIEQENGIVVINPLAKSVDVELVGAYGTSTSTNFGNVELVLKVNVKIPESKISFGGNAGSKGTMAFDEEGNVYKMVYPSVSSKFDVVEGMVMRIALKENDAFQKVPKAALVFPVVKLFTHLNYDVRDEIIFKNVPVLWDVEH